MADALLRQWNLLQRIPAHPRKISTAELKTALNEEGIHVEMRSLQRDLNYLSHLFPLVQDDRSKPYGWSWAEFDSGKHIPGFSPCVAMTLLMAQKFLIQTFPKAQLNIIEKHFKQAEEVLNELHSDDLLDWRKKVHIHARGFHLQPVEVNAGISNTIYDAVLCQKTLRVVYFSKNSNADKTMTIEPLGIVVRDAMTYVICNTDQYDDYIQLALHRFRDVEICGSFVYPVDFDLEQYINSGKLGFSLSDQSINITLRFSSSAGSHLLESPINASQTHTVTDNHITVQTEVFNNKELRWWILGFGDGVEVIEPLELRKEIANTLGTALKLYQQ